MLCEQAIPLARAQELLRRCGLEPGARADYTVGVFDDADGGGTLVATGSRVGDMLQMIAVDPERQGEELSARLLTHLLGEAAQKGIHCLYLFTKPASVRFFRSLGFALVAEVEGQTALLEWGRPGIAACRAALAERFPPGVQRSALVMNANPFTLGHRRLIEHAARESGQVLVFAVEEELSEFPFAVRLALLQAGTADLPNVTVLPGGRYIISSLTFPSYFSKEADRAALHSAIDAELFARHIAPAAGVTRRYVGTEPLSPTTALYNETLRRRLPAAGIELCELPRFELFGEPVSASRVRALIRESGPQAAAALVPETTLRYLTEHEAEVSTYCNRSIGARGEGL